jgi:5-methylcytosine-specific restriction endonuclease McrA
VLRTCTTCNQAKPIDEFAPHRASRGGRRPRCRTCTAAYNRQWRLRNLERCKAVAQAYKEANRERLREHDRRRYEADTAAAAAKALRWYVANRDRKLVQVAEWQRANRDRVRSNVRARVARKAAAPGHASAAQVAARIAYFGGRCWMCGRLADAIDHVKPLARGGSDWPANLRPACKSCNSSKRDRWPVDVRTRR